MLTVKKCGGTHRPDKRDNPVRRRQPELKEPRGLMNATNVIRQPAVPRAAYRVATPVAREGGARVYLAVILFYLLLVPPQFNVTIGNVYLSPFRIFLIGSSLYLMFAGLRKELRWTVPDIFVAFGTLWIWFASYMSSGSVTTALVIGGSHTVDIGLAYFAARVGIQTPNDLRRFLLLCAPGAAFMGAMVLAEAVSHQLIVQRISGMITGAPYPRRWDVRLGFMRGMGSFPHPILAGIFLGSLLPLYWFSGLRGWPKYLGMASSVLGVFSMSSAAMLALVVGGALSIYDWLTEQIRNLTWQMFLFFSAILYFAVELTSNTGFYGLLIRYASLNTASAYNRVLIWEFGTDNIEKSPFFGIGYADWDRPDWMHSGSFDHFWLITALRFGIPETFFLLGATLIALVMIALKSRSLPYHDARLLRGVTISLAVFALGVNSVSLWMAPLVWYFMLLGVTVSLASVRAPSVQGRQMPGRCRCPG